MHQEAIQIRDHYQQEAIDFVYGLDESTLAKYLTATEHQHLRTVRTHSHFDLQFNQILLTLYDKMKLELSRINESIRNQPAASSSLRNYSAK